MRCSLVVWNTSSLVGGRRIKQWCGKGGSYGWGVEVGFIFVFHSNSNFDESNWQFSSNGPSLSAYLNYFCVSRNRLWIIEHFNWSPHQSVCMIVVLLALGPSHTDKSVLEYPISLYLHNQRFLPMAIHLFYLIADICCIELSSDINFRIVFNLLTKFEKIVLNLWDPSQSAP